MVCCVFVILTMGIECVMNDNGLLKGPTQKGWKTRARLLIRAICSFSFSHFLTVVVVRMYGRPLLLIGKTHHKLKLTLFKIVRSFVVNNIYYIFVLHTHTSHHKTWTSSFFVSNVRFVVRNAFVSVFVSGFSFRSLFFSPVVAYVYLCFVFISMSMSLFFRAATWCEM